MARTKSLIPLQSTRFADAYDVYVDYGKGQPVKMKNNEATFMDVEQFLSAQSDPLKMMNHKKSNESKSRTKTNYKYNSTAYCGPSLTPNLVYRSSFFQYGQENINPKHTHIYQSSFTPNRPRRNLSSSSSSTTTSLSRNKPRLIYDETLLTNKQYDPRVNAFIDYIHEKFNIKTKQISDERKLARAKFYQVTSGQPMHERVYPTINETKLCLQIAVNGLSKSLRGQIPLSNLNINNGDYGDDAGMFVDNRNFSFVGLADGAGGNRSLGLNPADFSQAVLSACRNILHKNNLHTKQLPRLILSAMEQVEASEIRGSSTLCLLGLDKEEHTLTSLNIGDSGFVIYRNNELYRRSTSTMNSSGSGPRQLFSLNDSLGIPCFINEKEVLRDCSLDTIKVQKGDLIILSSDGLWDVVKTDQLKQIIERNANTYLQRLADDLLNQAVEGYIADGRDDILIIVCRVDEL